jgi:DNA uptake protein ComE-like DNA-binding protein
MRRRITLMGVSALLLALPFAAHAQDSTAAAKPAAESHEKAHKAAMPKLDLNSAEKADLQNLPGMTEDLAEKIGDGRPYKSRAELLSKKILTKAEYAKIRSHVMVKVEKKAAK